MEALIRQAVGGQLEQSHLAQVRATVRGSGDDDAAIRTHDQPEGLRYRHGVEAVHDDAGAIAEGGVEEPVPREPGDAELHGGWLAPRLTRHHDAAIGHDGHAVAPRPGGAQRDFHAALLAEGEVGDSLRGEPRHQERRRER